MMMMEQANPGTSILRDRSSLGLELLGRLAPAISRQQATVVLESAAAQLATSFPQIHRGRGVEIVAATLSADGKTVFLEIEDIQPVMQMKINLNIKAADGTPVKLVIHNTINKLGKGE